MLVTNEVETKTRTLIDDAETRFDTKRDDLLNQYVAELPAKNILNENEIVAICKNGKKISEKN